MAINWPKIEYVEAENGMLYPKLEHPKQPAGSIGKYGEMRRRYLQEYRSNLQHDGSGRNAEAASDRCERTGASAD